MECQRAREAMLRASDNELEVELIASFQEHLSCCALCAHRFAYLSKLLALVRGKCYRYSAPSTLRVRILSSFPHRIGSPARPGD